MKRSPRGGAGDANALASLDAYRDRLARALASVVNIVDPDVIVLGGGLSNIARLYDGLEAAGRELRFFGRAGDEGCSQCAWRQRRGARRGVVVGRGSRGERAFAISRSAGACVISRHEQSVWNARYRMLAGTR